MARKLEVEIVGDASSLRRAVGQADSSSSKLGRTFGTLAKGGVLAAGAAGVGALIYTLKTGIGEFQQSQKVAAQTNAVIKSTGGVAKVSAKEVDKLAGSLMKKSGVDDEVIASGENMLLTFTKIHNEVGKGNDIFSQATKVTLDLSVAMGKDMQSSAILVGKALNDPIKGVTALTRAGVQLTDGQKKTIKSLVESGHTMEAQKIILKELNRQFGGSAEAAGKTLPGQINILKQTFANWSGEMVAKTIPILQQTIGWLRDHWPEIRAKFMEMWQAVQPALVAFGALVATVAGLVQKHWGTIGPIVEKFALVVKIALQQVTNIIRLFVAVLKGDWGGAWAAVKAILSTALVGIKALLQLWLSTVGALAKRIGVEIKDGVVAGLKGIASAVWEAISGVGSYIASRAGQIVGWGASVATHLLSGIKNGLKGIGEYVVNLVKRALNALIDKVNSVLEVSFDTHIPHVGKVTINPPDIPHLAAGGIVRSPTLAMVGESGPEAVVPLSSRSAAPTQVNLQIDGRTFAALLIDPLRGEVRQLRRAGGVF